MRDGNKDGQGNQVETRLNNADMEQTNVDNTTQVSTQGQQINQEIMPGSTQEEEIHRSWADKVEEKELNTGERQQEDEEQGNTDEDYNKKDCVEVSFEGNHHGTNTAEKGTRLDGVKEATEGSPSVIIHNLVQREGKVQENVQSIEATAVDATSDKMKKQMYVEQDADPPDQSSSEKKSSLVKELHDLISHNIDVLEVEEDVRDLHKEDKEEIIKQNKENILKQADISPNSKSNNKGQEKGKKNAIDKQIPLRVVPKRNATKSNVK
ncbi:uncharacterized protein LOC132057828 [Lycium ferocissimum]|uniref:uncharacterized protein LOC132057828 n=1 Tax=Lycium ferocissimum TaxID=112874 RepID=UPI002814B01E|nr:uncharacterized protein LOC132057828 [Lycium ferocissimum]